MKTKLIFCLALVLSGVCNAAITFPKAPEGGQQIALEQVAKTLKQIPSFFGGAQVEELTIADTHLNYNLSSYSAIISGNMLSNATATNPATYWRYFVMRGTNGVGLVELKVTGQAEKPLKFIDLSQAPAAEMRIALRVAEKLPQVQKQDYEFRFLNLSPIHFRAVWLHGKSDDIIIPLPETYGRYVAYQPYSESEIVKFLKPEVEK